MVTKRTSIWPDAVAAAVAFAVASPSAFASAKIGARAPEVQLEALLQAPEGSVASWEALQGKVVVLEFWATWCLPCVDAIPHLNELAEKFADKPVQFITITHEPKGVIEKFLKRRPIRCWVGLDTDRSMFRAYQARSIPRTVLVDKQGRIAAIMHPTHLSEKTLNDLLAGKRPVTMPAGKQTRAGELQPSDVGPLFQILIRPAPKGGVGGSSVAPGKFTERCRTLRGAIESAYDVRSKRIIVTEKLPDRRYDIVVNMPKGQDSLVKPMLRNALELTFAIKVRRERREMDVYVLSVAKGRELGLRKPVVDGSGTQGGPGRCAGTNVPIDKLTWMLENRLDRPVLDGTGLKGRYSWRLKWDPKKEGGIIDAVREQLGLELAPATRPIEVAIVEKQP